ncbi:MAG: SIR2-like protein [Aeromicrobium sp.]|nr:SIR2-like protein [Aeromicrobium sp.]
MAAEDDLRSAIAGGNCVVVVGTGVSMAISQDPASTWLGLLQAGVEFAINQTGADRDWAIDVLATLDGPSSADDFLKAADEITDALGGSSDAEFALWMRRTAGYLEVRAPAVGEALAGLGCPLVTTNYDDLLEKTTQRSHTTWLNFGATQLVIAGSSPEIAHLHGYWSEPQSIVLTSDQYALMTADENVELLRRAMASVRCLVYVGFGEGLSDPSFGRLREWMRDQLPDAQLSHYRLCRQAELSQLMREHVGERIYPLAYGEDYEDLVPFLESLKPETAIVPSVTPSVTGLEILEEQVRESAVLGDYVRDLDHARVNDLLIPPVILPVPHAQYIAAAKEQDSTRIERCNLDDEIHNSRVLLAGDEYVGVTSALLWLNSKACLADSALIPVTVDFKKIGAGFNPLRREIVKALKAQGMSLRENDQLPRVSLILDNVHVNDQKRLGRVILELQNGICERLYLGCRTGTEVELLSQLNSPPSDFLLRYIGRLNTRDVTALAQRVDSARSASIVEKAVDVVRLHHLPRTPFTFSMIISTLLRGESLLSAVSSTALLDAYLDQLLGRGSRDDDSRFGFDAFGRSLALERLAERFVDKGAGSIPQHEAVELLQELFASLDWLESPIKFITDLHQRKVLVLRGGTITFTQSSYLHLFAARRARSDSAFRGKLIADPLYYGPILSHYAALVRTDRDLLEELQHLLDEALGDSSPSDARIFKPYNEDGQLDLTDIGTLERQIDKDAEEARRPDDEQQLDVLEDSEDEDLDPFPLQPINDAPPLVKLISTVTLMSNLVRDTEVIEDQEFRRGILARVICAWARLVASLETDPGYESAASESAHALATTLGIAERHAERFVREVSDFFALSVVMGGISATLTSRKLVPTVLRNFEDEEFAAEAALAIIGQYILFDAGVAGWTSPLENLLKLHAQVRGVDTILRRLVLGAYINSEMQPDDVEALERFLADQTVLHSDARTEADRSRLKGSILNRFRRLRLQNRDKAPGMMLAELASDVDSDGA